MALMPAKKSAHILTLLLSLWFAASAQAQAWKLEDQLKNDCLWETSTLLADAQVLPVTVPQSNPALQLIANKISLGMAQSGHAAGAVKIERTPSVDLNVVVSNDVDKQYANSDLYWSYYLDCDRWNVSFNQEVPTKQMLEAAEVERVSNSPCELSLAWLTETHNDFINACECAAFATVESLETSEIVPPTKSTFADSKAKPVHSMLQIISCFQHPVIDALRELHVSAMHNYPYLEHLTQVVTRLTAPVDEGS